jgi:hypothetical protein
MLKTVAFGVAIVIFGLSAAVVVDDANGQAASSPTGITLKAVTTESNRPSDVKIDIVRWSTAQERDAIIAALSPPPAGARGPAERPDVTDPFGAFGRNQNAAAGGAQAAGTQAAGGAQAAGGTQADAGRGGRGGGRGGRGGGRGGRGGDDQPAPFDPVASLGTAIGNAPTLGYLWTNENSGYSIKYAYRDSLPDGSERIILATNRPLSFLNAATPAAGPQFMVVELRLNSKTGGEGRAVMNTKVAALSEPKTIALEDYATATAVLRNVKR